MLPQEFYYLNSKIIFHYHKELLAVKLHLKGLSILCQYSPHIFEKITSYLYHKHDRAAKSVLFSQYHHLLGTIIQGITEVIFKFVKIQLGKSNTKLCQN